MLLLHWWDRDSLVIRVRIRVRVRVGVRVALGIIASVWSQWILTGLIGAFIPK